MRSVLFVVLIGLFSVALGGCGQDRIPSSFPFDELEQREKEPVVFGQVPSRSVIELFDQRKQLLDVLSRALDRPVELRVADSYDGIMEGMAKEEYDLAILGPLAYVRAVDEQQAPYRPLVRPVRYGRPFYRAMIFTHANSGIKSPGELRGKTMAFTDPNSTSGYLFPRAQMIQETGIDPLTDTRRAEFLGSHDQVVKAVLNESYDAGAVFDDARSLVLEDNLDEQLPVLTRSKPIPSEPIVIHDDLSDSTVTTLRTFFLNLHDNQPKLLETLGGDIDRYEDAGDSVYDDVRTVIEVLEGVPSP